jgi:predicted transcriptional regulator
MAKLGAVAHYSAKGDRNAHVSMEDPLENRGYALWLACQGKIRTSKARKTPGPEDRGVGAVLGFEIEVNLKRKVFDLWPGLNQMDRASQDGFISEIYAYLRASGNAICVRKPGLGEHGIPLWWIRETWNDVKAVGIYRQTELTARERRLTPTEAGEDRPPAPVTVKQRAEAAAAEAVATAAAANTPAPTENRPGDIIAVLKASPQPLYQKEIADALGITNQSTGRLLRELEEQGKVHRRQESRGERPDDASGRYRYLYWHTKKVPLRKTPLDLGNQTMERVWAMKPGETLSTTWMSPGNQKQVAQMVEEGLLEYINKGTPEERIKLAPATPETAEKPAEPPAPAPAPVKAQPPAPAKAAAPAARPAAPAPVAAPASALGEIAEAVERIVEARVSQRLAGQNDREVTLMHDLADAREQIRRLEATLVTRASELSAVTRDRDQAVEKLNTIRKSLGL